MNGFTTQDWKTINAIDAEGRLISKFLEPVDYLAKDGTRYRIPAYQPTDYASVPPLFWGAPLLLIPYGWWSLPASLHDAAYQNLLLVVPTYGTTRLAGLDRSECDALLCESMASIKPAATVFEKAQMDAIYEGVTIGGWHAFKEDRL